MSLKWLTNDNFLTANHVLLFLLQPLCIDARLLLSL